jgi:phosphomannomutase
VLLQRSNYFKAHDIRCRLGEELNDEIAYRIGRAFVLYLKPKKVVVGGDIRLTSEPLKLSFQRSYAMKVQMHSI